VEIDPEVGLQRRTRSADNFPHGFPTDGRASDSTLTARPKLIERIIRLTLWTLSALVVAGYLYATIPALGRATPANPIEAAVLEQAARFATGQPAFHDADGAPDVALMPGFPFVVSGLVRMFDAEPWVPRFVTLLALLMAAALAAVVVRLETNSWTLGVASAGFLLLGQQIIGRGAGISGPEALGLLLVLAGCVALRFMPGIPGAVLASLPFAAACLTHPAGLWFAIAALLHLATHDRRSLVAYALGLVVFAGGGYVGLSYELGPWFNYHAWDVPLKTVRFAPIALVRYLGTQLLGMLGVLSLAAVLAFAMPVRPWRGAVGLWTWIAFAALGAGMAATQSTLGAPDALRPVVVALAIAGPISIQRVTHHLSAWPGSSRLGGQGVVLTALALQFLMLLSHLTGAVLGI
jgi:hypothetical protein